MNKVYLLIGTNLGNRNVNLDKARKMIKNVTGKIIKESSIYETAAWGNQNQDTFLNQALIVESEMEQEELLTSLKSIEKNLGRKTESKWGPRIIDIDILFIEDLIYKSKKLTVPHPEIENRKFTLIPLAEIAPDFYHPVLKKSITRLLEICKDSLEVVKMPVANEV